MIELTFSSQPNMFRNILCIGAHSDDIEIGCGGSILKMIETVPNINITWIVLGSHGVRTNEAFESAKKYLHKVKNKQIIVKEFKDGFFPYCGGEIKEYFEQLKRMISPDLIFTHYRHDLHQDHRLVSELTWNTFRNHMILEYEILKYDGDIGNPNFYIHLSEDTCKLKIQNLLNLFTSQVSKQWFTEDSFWAMLRLRGVESNSLEKYAEAFYCRKLVFNPIR